MTWEQHIEALETGTKIDRLNFERDLCEAYHHWFLGHFANRTIDLEPDLSPEEGGEFKAVQFPGVTHRTGVARFHGPDRSSDLPELIPIIHTTFPDSRHQRFTDRIESKVTVSHYVRVAARGSTRDHDSALARQIADLITLLYESEKWGLLRNLDFLNRKHIRGPVELPIEGWAVRVVTFQVMIRQAYLRGQKNV